MIEGGFVVLSVPLRPASESESLVAAVFRVCKTRESQFFINISLLICFPTNPANSQKCNGSTFVSLGRLSLFPDQKAVSKGAPTGVTVLVQRLLIFCLWRSLGRCETKVDV